MSTTIMMDLDFARYDIDQQERYEIFKGNDKVGCCFMNKGFFFVKNADDKLLYSQGTQGDTHLVDAERLFFLMHAAQTLRQDLKGHKGIDWNAPLGFRDPDSTSARIIDAHFQHKDQVVHLLVEYPHPVNHKPIVDIWAYDPADGRPLSPLLRMNPLHRYDIINTGSNPLS